MGLFSRSDKVTSRTATNAPRHWPTITVNAWLPGNEGFHYLQIGATFAEQLQPSGAQLRFYDQRLYDDGVLTVPFVVSEADEHTAVFVYPAVTDQAAAHFSGVRTLLRQRDGWNTVYYAPEAIQPAKPAKVVEPLDTPHFSRVEKDRRAAEYALWWPTANDADIASSPALAHLDRWFASTDGYASFLFSSFVRTLGLTKGEGEHALFALPSQAVMVPMDGPGRLPLYLHASQSEGLWIALDTRTSAAERAKLLGLLADLGERFLAIAADKNVPPLDDERGVALRWWRATREDAWRKAAAGGDGLRIGRINEEETLRRRQAGATTAAERQSEEQRLQPADELMLFATSALDMAVDMMQATDGTPDDRLPEPGPAAPPSLCPFVVVLAGTDTYSRMFWDADAPEATAAAQELIGSLEHVSMAAFVCDTYLRSADGSQRTDAVLVRAHKIGDPQSVLLAQRYRPRRKGQAFARLGNAALVGQDAPLIGDAPVQVTWPAAQPSEAVVAHARATLDATVHLVTVIDKSGASSVRGTNGPVHSPFMHALKGTDRVHYSFALLTSVQAYEMCTRVTAKESEISMASFVYDEIVLKNGTPHRSFHFIVQERSSPATFHFVQRYATPQPGTPFETLGDLELRGTAQPIFQ